jgi:hypothetical protein
MEILQKDVDRLAVWAVENAIKINPSSCLVHVVILCVFAVITECTDVLL